MRADRNLAGAWQRWSVLDVAQGPMRCTRSPYHRWRGLPAASERAFSSRIARSFRPGHRAERFPFAGTTAERRAVRLTSKPRPAVGRFRRESLAPDTGPKGSLLALTAPAAGIRGFSWFGLIFNREGEACTWYVGTCLLLVRTCGVWSKESATTCGVWSKWTCGVWSCKTHQNHRICGKTPVEALSGQRTHGDGGEGRLWPSSNPTHWPLFQTPPATPG